MSKTNRIEIAPTSTIRITGVGRDHRNRIFIEIAIARDSADQQKLLLPLETLNTDSEKLIQAAAAAGIPLTTSHSRAAFLKDVQSKLEKINDLSARSDMDVATRVGWLNGSFVTPAKSYSPRDKRLGNALGTIDRSNRWQPLGTLDRWKAFVEWASRGNPLLIFATCVAFTAPLLELLGQAGFGIMLVGDTSTGKTTASHFVSSSWGGDRAHPRGFLDGWYSTANNIERLAVQFRDSLLVLDDTTEIEAAMGTTAAAKSLAKAVFTLVGGVAKGRFTDPVTPEDWRLIFWATSTRTTCQILELGRIPWEPAYGVRLIEIPADFLFGVFNNISHRASSPAEYADQIKDATARCYGTAIPAFLEKLVVWRATQSQKLERWLKNRINELRCELNINSQDGVAARIGGHFGAIYAAGCLAQKAGVVPWSVQEIEDAIVTIYRAHRRFTQTVAVPQDPIAVLRDYVEENRGRFVDVTKNTSGITESMVQNAPGFVSRSQGGREFSFLPSTFRNKLAVPGGHLRLLHRLEASGLLIHDQPGADGPSTLQIKRQLLPPRGGDDGRRRVYCVSERIIAARIDQTK